MSRLSLTFVFFLLAGCARTYVPVEGSITLDDIPLTVGTVNFFPEDKEKGALATGAISPEGTFRLMTLQNFGAKPATYKVTFQHPLLFRQGGPRHYADPAKTPFTVEVPKGGKKDFVFALTTM